MKSLSRVPDPQRPHGLQPSRLLCPWDFPGKSTGVGCHCLLHCFQLAPSNANIESVFKVLFICLFATSTLKIHWINYFGVTSWLPWRRQWQPTPVLLPGKSHGWMSRMTERLHFHFSLSCIGEGNGNPLQCSCLENPRDRGNWWTAVYGVAKS